MTAIAYLASDNINHTPVSGANPLPVTAPSSAPMSVAQVAGGLPAGATPVAASSGNVANASAVATLAAVSAKTNYITGFQVTASGATAGLPVVVTVAGILGGTLSYIFTFPAGVLVGAAPLLVTFPDPVPASAVNVAIVVTCPASGSGGTNAAVSAQGYVV